MSPEDVLAVIVEDYTHQALNDPEAELGVVLTFESTVADWRDACDLVSWRPLGLAMNERFQVGIQDDRWREILEPPKRRTLRGICEEIAATATKRVVEPLRLFGRDCREAGYFFAVKRILSENGIAVGDLRPSTPLFPYLRAYAGLFLREISILAPGQLPPFQAKDRVYNGLLFAFVGAILLSGLLVLLKAPGPLMAAAVLLAGAVYAGIWLRARSRRPLDVAAFGDLQTFGDLCRRLAGFTR